MPPRRGKLLAISTAAVAIVALAIAGFVAKDRIREEWYIWHLTSADEEIRLHAADVLAEMKSVRAVPELIRLIGKEKRERVERSAFFKNRTHARYATAMTPIAHAIYRIGDVALPLLPVPHSGQQSVLDGVVEQIRSSPPNAERVFYEEFHWYSGSTPAYTDR